MRHLKKNKGFTLLEVLIASGILIIVTGAAVGTAIMAINSGVFSKNRTVAQELARTQIERVREIRETDFLDDDNETGWAAKNSVDKGGKNGEEKFAREKPSGGFGFVRGARTRKIDNQIFEIATTVETISDNFNGSDNGRGETGYVDESLNVRKVTVTVSWQEPFLGKDKAVRIVSYITNNK